MHNKIRYYVHPDIFDSDDQQSSFFLLSWLLFCMRLSFLAGMLQQQLLIKSKRLNYHLTKNSRISALKSSLTGRLLSRFSLINAIHGAWIHAVIYCESSVNRFGMPALGVPETTCLRTKTKQNNNNNKKKNTVKLRRYIKSAAHKYWDNLCNTSCNNGKIYKVFKCLTARNTPYGKSG